MVTNVEFLGGKKESRFLKLEDGKVYQGTYLGSEQLEGRFGRTIQYTFLIDGEEKSFTSKSLFLARTFEGQENKKIAFKRTGRGMNTRWEVRIL